MDIRTKITFIIRSVFRKDKWTILENGTPIKKEIIILNNKIIKSEDIEFDEYKQVIVEIESDDQYAYIEIDSNNDAEKRKVIKNNEKEQEINPGGSSDNMLVPGVYGFKVHINNKVKELDYKIAPSSNIGWEGLLNLRSYVESMAKGLSYDFYKQKMELASNENYEDLNVFDRYSKLTKDAEDVLININNITKNPLEDLKREYKEKRYSSRPDRKSQRWSTTKGLYKNTSFINQRFFYEKDTTITTNIIENIWLKKLIKAINKEVTDIQGIFYKQISLIERNKEEKEKELNNKTKERNIIRHKKNTLKSDKQEAEHRVYNLNRDIICMSEKQEKLNGYYNNLEIYRLRLVYIINNSWLKDINDKRYVKKPTLKMLKDYRYNYLFNICKEIGINDNEGSENISVKYSNKLTSTLFEYYVLIHIMKIINSQGYQWPNELMNADFNYISEMEDTSNEVILKFKGKKNDVEIAYDVEIRNDKKGFMRGSATHTRPDIRVSLYEKNGDIRNSIIIEIKCRDGECVFSKRNEENKVESQLKDYRYSFRYGKNKKDIINQVIMVCLYTKNYKEKFEIGDDEDMLGIPLDITNKNEIPKGHESLKYEIERFLM